jgi:hypothetical protein
MVMSPEGLGTKIDYAGEDQQQFRGRPMKTCTSSFLTDLLLIIMLTVDDVTQTVLLLLFV